MSTRKLFAKYEDHPIFKNSFLAAERIENHLNCFVCLVEELFYYFLDYYISYKTFLKLSHIMAMVWTSPSWSKIFIISKATWHFHKEFLSSAQNFQWPVCWSHRLSFIGMIGMNYLWAIVKLNPLLRNIVKWYDWPMYSIYVERVFRTKI